MRYLSGEDTRRIIDCEQVYLARLAAQRELDLRFKGSMAWKTVSGKRYLYKKKAGVSTSLGPESEMTLSLDEDFRFAKAQAKTRSEALKARLRDMAPVNRAMGIGRVPKTSARVLRRLDRLGLLGTAFRIAGTHALYAYERLGGVHFDADTIATHDIDLLYDARATLKLLSSDVRDAGLIGVLQRVDKSFAPLAKGSFRAANDQGFMVDLITPSTKNPATRKFRDRIGEDEADLTAAEIDGLTWLESSPAMTVIVIDERGFPLRMIVPDPRYFSAHKAWLAAREDRPADKRRRDMAQARAVTQMIKSVMPHLKFDDPALQALPADVRALGLALEEDVPRLEDLHPDKDDL